MRIEIEFDIAKSTEELKKYQIRDGDQERVIVFYLLQDESNDSDEIEASKFRPQNKIMKTDPIKFLNLTEKYFFFPLPQSDHNKDLENLADERTIYIGVTEKELMDEKQEYLQFVIERFLEAIAGETDLVVLRMSTSYRRIQIEFLHRLIEKLDTVQQSTLVLVEGQEHQEEVTKQVFQVWDSIFPKKKPQRPTYSGISEKPLMSRLHRLSTRLRRFAGAALDAPKGIELDRQLQANWKKRVGLDEEFLQNYYFYDTEIIKRVDEGEFRFYEKFRNDE